MLFKKQGGGLFLQEGEEVTETLKINNRFKYYLQVSAGLNIESFSWQSDQEDWRSSPSQNNNPRIKLKTWGAFNFKNQASRLCVQYRAGSSSPPPGFQLWTLNEVGLKKRGNTESHDHIITDNKDKNLIIKWSKNHRLQTLLASTGLEEIQFILLSALFPPPRVETNAWTPR